MIGHCPNNIDISVFASNFLLTPKDLTCELTSQNIDFDQDVYILGFPFGFTGKNKNEDLEYPFPCIKKTSYSATINDANNSILLFDGYCNYGNSGGPVIYKPIESTMYSICGVVSSQISEYSQIYECSNPIRPIDDTKTEPLNPLFCKQPTGFIRVTPIEHALQIIQDNPNGFQLN